MSQQQVANDDVADVIVSKPKYIYGVIVLYCLFMLDFAARLGVLAVFPSMQKELGFTDAELGLIGSAVLLSMGLFVLPLSYLADKTSKKRAITVMSLLWGVGCTLCGFVTNLFLILGGRFLVGIGNSSYAPVSVSLLTSWTKKSRWGSAIGIYNSSMAVGLALGTSRFRPACRTLRLARFVYGHRRFDPCFCRTFHVSAQRYREAGSLSKEE